MRYLNPPLSARERVEFVAAARACIGVRWRHQGRSLQGLDCGGLVVYALAGVSRIVRDSVGYGRVAYRGSLEAVLEDNFGSILPKKEMRVGDVALMRFKGEPSHVGIIGDYLYGGFSLIHAFVQNREVVEGRLSEDWLTSIVGVYRP